TLFIYPELYLGDMIQFGRYALLAEARGAKVVISAQPILRQLLTSMSPSIEIIGEEDVPKHFDFHCPLMSLPFAFGTTLATIPANVPYLHPEAERLRVWKEKLGENGFKIGICWQGTKTGYALRLQRSFAPDLFRNISEMKDVRLISLQKPGSADVPPENL